MNDSQMKSHRLREIRHTRRDWGWGTWISLKGGNRIDVMGRLALRIGE